MRRIAFFITSLFIFISIKGQSLVGDWDSYTSVLNVKDIILIDDVIYAASTGGLIEYDINADIFETYTIWNGLSRNDIRCLALDKYDRLWLGMSDPDGEITIWNSQTKSAEKIFDAFDFGDELNNIVSIDFYENKAFAAYQYNVDWGIAYFKIIDGEYRYQDRLEAFPVSITGINKIQVIGDTLWIATSTGLLFAKLNQTDLKPESAWQSVQLPITGNVAGLVQFDEQLLFSLENEIYSIQNGTIQLFNGSQTSSILDLMLDNSGNLSVLTSSGVDQYNSGSWNRMVPVSAIKCVYNNDDRLWGGSVTKCLWKNENNKPFYLIPNTILDNTYTALYVNADGSLMAGTQKGFSLLTDNGWYNIRGLPTTEASIHSSDWDWSRFVADTISYSLSYGDGRIYNLVKDKNENYYAPLYNSFQKYLKPGGLLEFNLNNLENYNVYDTTDQKLAASEGKGGSSHFLVIACVDLDQNQNLWISNNNAQNDSVIAVMTPNKRWIHFGIEESNGYLNYLTTAIICRDNLVIFGSEVHTGETPSPANGGIVILDHKGTLFDKTDDQWYRITTSNGLANNAIYGMAFDQEKVLWIMTADGIQRAVLASDFPTHFFSQIDDPVLTSVPFAKECRIRVDAMNNKWISTVGYGVKVYTYNGVWLNDVEGFTTENSGLLSNTVLDIAFNNEKGIVYLATTKGISVYKSPYAVYGEKYNDLDIFPTPYEIPSSKPLVIDGLLQESDVKIITLNGTFIRHLSYIDGNVIGQQAFWDGKDNRGRYVSSGVYLCMAFTKEGDTTVGKIAVIRK